MVWTAFEATARLYDKDIDREDSGMALITQVDDEKDEEFFVRLQSYSLVRNHKTMQSLIGKKIRVKIEVLD